MKTLATLKEMLCHEQNLHTTFNYFFDLSDEHIFSQLPDHQPIEQVTDLQYLGMLKALRQGISATLQQSIQAEDGCFFVAPSQHLIHGAFLIKGLPVAAFYFKDIELGIYAVIRGLNTETYKFSLIKETGFTVH